MLSRKAKYALIAAQHLAGHYQGGPRLITDIAREEALPKKFLELILLELKNAGLLDSKKGKGGGYTLAKDPAGITVGAIIRTIDGPIAPFRCASASAPVPCEECHDPNTCAIRSVMTDARDALSGVFDQVTLADLLRREEELRHSNDQGMMFYI